MAQRKSAPSASSKSGGPAKVTSAKSGTGSRPAAKSGAAAKAPGRPPVKKKPGKSIVNQKQTPWGLIITTVLIVVFAAGIVTYAVASHKSNQPSASGGCSAMIGNNSTTYLNELKCAADIQGVTFKAEANRDHKTGVLQYDTAPPIGGNHSPYWADCSGTVYPQAIANENAVHMLEHGAVWITYKPGLAQSEVTTLSALVNGKDRMAMSPYPGLTSPISLQAWGYQLKVDSAGDPRIQKFIEALRYNPKTTPEYGATCSQPSFKSHPSTFGKPLETAA